MNWPDTTTTVFLLANKYTVIARCRPHADEVAGLGGLTIEANCLSGYSRYPLLQPQTQLSPNQRGSPIRLALKKNIGNTI